MKMKKYLYLLLLALVPAMTFTACGDDKDDLDDITPSDVNFSEPTFKETNNSFILTYSQAIGSTQVGYTETYTFQGEQVVSVSISMTFPSESLAKQFMEEIAKDPQSKEAYRNITRNGKTCTYDATEYYKDMTKSEIREQLQWRVDEWEHFMHM